jgi:hypothetical protein
MLAAALAAVLLGGWFFRRHRQPRRFGQLRIDQPLPDIPDFDDVFNRLEFSVAQPFMNEAIPKYKGDGALTLQSDLQFQPAWHDA